MSTVNTSGLRDAAALARARGASPADRLASLRAAGRIAVEAPDARPSTVETIATPDLEIVEATGQFIMPPPRVCDTLSDPRLGHCLRAAAAALEEEGTDPSDRYTAAVLRTHLEARNRLALRANALLKA